MIVPLALSALLAACAPHVGPITMTAIVYYESGGRAFAIGDNTARRSYFPEKRDDAVALARRLLDAGHNIDVGYAQVNSDNFPAYGLDAASAFEPCTNVATGASILAGAYAAARHAYGSGADALVHALSAYNTGRFWAGLPYVRGVYRTAAALRFESPPLASASERGRRAVPVYRGSNPPHRDGDPRGVSR